MEVNKLEKTLKVGLALAMVALALTVTALAVSSLASSGNAATPQAHTGQSAVQISSEQSQATVVSSGGCQDSAANVPGFDPISGTICPYP